MRVERAAGAAASPFAAAAAAAGGAPMVIVVVPDGSCPTSSAAAALAAAAGGAFGRAESFEGVGCQPGGQPPLLLSGQSSGGSTMEAAARAALAALGWGSAAPTTSAASSPGSVLHPHTPASPSCGPYAPAGHSHGYYHPQQQLMQQQQQQHLPAVMPMHSCSRLAGSSQPLHAPMQPMQPMQPAQEFPGQRQPSFQAWAQQPQLAAPASNTAAHLQRHCSAPEEMPQSAFNFTFSGPGAVFAAPSAPKQCGLPAPHLARTYTAPSQMPAAPVQPATAAGSQHTEAALHSPFAAVPGPLPGFDAASATVTAPASPRTASLPGGAVERRVSAQLPGNAGAAESPFAAVASLPLPRRAASPAHAASPSPPPPAPAAQAPACEGSLLSLGAGDWPSLFADAEAAAPGDSADLQKLYAIWQDGRMSMGF